MSTNEILVPLKEAKLRGELSLPPGATNLVIFAHGSGSGRRSPRNQFVANALRKDGKTGTFLFDLLTAGEQESEGRTRHLRFNISLLAERLVAVTEWVLDHVANRDINVGYFGSSTGAAAALVAAADLPNKINAVVSRGGRPDLAGDALGRVRASTLLIVGGYDRQVISLNEEAYYLLHCERALRIVPEATHLFEEAGALEKVAVMTADWFGVHLHAMHV